jgi:DNA polymerase (family 10)
MEGILEARVAHGVAVEINANPWRLDWCWHERALELGCILGISPDAHSAREIDLTHWGLAMQRKSGVPSTRVLKCFTLPQLMQHLRKRMTMPARAA